MNKNENNDKNDKSNIENKWIHHPHQIKCYLIILWEKIMVFFKRNPPYNIRWRKYYKSWLRLRILMKRKEVSYLFLNNVGEVM